MQVDAVLVCAKLSRMFWRIEGDRGASVDGDLVHLRLVASNFPLPKLHDLSMRRRCGVADRSLVDPMVRGSDRPVGDSLLDPGQPAGAPPQCAERGWSSCRTPRVFHSFPSVRFLAGAGHYGY